MTMNISAPGAYPYSDGIGMMSYQLNTEDTPDFRWQLHTGYPRKHSTSGVMSPTTGPSTTTIYNSGQMPWTSTSYYRSPGYSYAPPHPAAYGSYTQTPTKGLVRETRSSGISSCDTDAEHSQSPLQRSPPSYLMLTDSYGRTFRIVTRPAPGVKRLGVSQPGLSVVLSPVKRDIEVDVSSTIQQYGY